MKSAMPKVTKTTRTRTPGRYNIYLDDEFAFAVDEKVLIKYNLFPETAFTSDEIETIKAAEFEQKAYQTALKYATGQMRTKMQVIMKLKEKDFPNQVIGQVITRLAQANVLDDRLYAEMYVQSAVRSGKLGPKGVAQKLKQMGVDRFLIEDALVQYPAEDQADAIDRQVEKLMAKYHHQSHFMAQRKTTQKLMQLGFDQGVIKRALTQYLSDHPVDQDDELEKLGSEAEKVAARYQQYDGWDFKNKVKAALYRKGYDLNRVDQWLKENPK
ncbi:RecX family transcriptional regulator [Weissella soli]|nr:RecX family transcriptional regulator [Weissella soli]